MASKPIILQPGTPKTLTDNVASVGSTAEIFQTAGGDFSVNGVKSGDYIVSLDGQNKGEIKKILTVTSNVLTTEIFPFAWSAGDSIKIYNSDERPLFLTNSLQLHLSGTADASTQAVIYTTSEELEPVRVYAGKSELYDIDSTNDTLLITVNGVEQTVLLTHDLSRTALSIVEEINSFFPFTVAFREQTSLSVPAIFYIQGITVKISPSNGANFFDICMGDFLFAKTLASTGVVGTSSRCSVQISTGSNRTIDVIIDGNILQVTLPDNSVFDPISTAASLNAQAGKCVATPGPGKLILLAENELEVNQDVAFLGLDMGITGLANIIPGDPNIEWNIDLDIFSNNFDLNFIAVDSFGDRSDPTGLEIEYKIDMPTLLPSLQAILDANTVECVAKLPTEEDIISLSGNYSPDGQGVLIDGQTVFSEAGVWSTDLNLEEGSNDLVIQTLDIFGNTSDSFALTIEYTNPYNAPLVTESTDGAPLRWIPLATSPSLSPADVENAKEIIANIFKPVTKLLDGIANLLKLARAFIVDNIVSGLNAIRNAVQKFINDTLQTLKDLTRGLGLWVISTIPRKAEVQGTGKEAFLDFCTRLQLGGPGQAFDGFINKLVTSFDDIFDPRRPQLSANGNAGGYAMAIADTGGFLPFWETLMQIKKVIQREVLDHGLSSPTNIRVSSENQRVVLTWKANDCMRPGKYIIKRALKAGGEPKFKKIKTSIPKPGQAAFTEELESDSISGNILSEYETIGSITFNPGYTSTSGGTNNAASTVNISSDVQRMDSEKFVDRIDFRFIDGKPTVQEIEEKNITDKVLTGATSYLDAFRDYFLVQQGSSEEPLTNGQTYYYKIYPEFLSTDENEEGQSFEVMGTPHAPELEFIEEDLIEQAKDKDPILGQGVKYILSGGIFDKDLAVYASNPSAKHLSVEVDGARISPESITYNKGVVIIRQQDIPQTSIKFSYWTKKEINTTRARLVGSKQGNFTFKKTDVEGNTLELIAGPTSSTTSGLGVGNTGVLSISNVQKITFVRDFGTTGSRTLTAEEVATIIRDQTGGLKVSVDKLDRIVLIDNQNASAAIASEIRIVKGSRILGFETGQTDSAGSFGAPPDWSRLALADFLPELNDLMRFIENNARNILRSMEAATNALTDFIDTLIKRVETFNDILKRLQELVEKLADILTFKAGFWLLTIPSRPGGTEYLKTALATSIGRPKADFAGGILFVYADGGQKKALDFIFKNVKV